MTQVKVTRGKGKDWSKPESNSFKMHGGYLTELCRNSRDENLLQVVTFDCLDFASILAKFLNLILLFINNSFFI
jgi:hypothetical protein